MPSKERRAEPLDSFETDVPITPRDRAAQQRLRERVRLSSQAYLDWCSWINRDPAPPRTEFPREPFEL